MKLASQHSYVYPNVGFVFFEYVLVFVECVLSSDSSYHILYLMVSQHMKCFSNYILVVDKKYFHQRIIHH